MKKTSIFAILVVLGVLIISSCQSRKHQCPGMYSQVDTQSYQYCQTID